MDKVFAIFKRYWIFYILAFIVIFGIKYLYSNATSDDLEFILAPTARWVEIISDISFEKEAHIGYINNQFRFIIASSCSGIQFMLITFATLLYSFVHRMGTIAKGFCWTILSLAFSVLLTIFVNGFRIVISILLPIYLQQLNVYNGLVTPERLHTIIGTFVYFVSLCLVFKIADKLSYKGLRYSFKHKYVFKNPAMFWYLFIALGVPLLNRAYKNDTQGFMSYAIIIFFVCLATTALLNLLSILYVKFIRKP